MCLLPLPSGPLQDWAVSVAGTFQPSPLLSHALTSLRRQGTSPLSDGQPAPVLALAPPPTWQSGCQALGRPPPACKLQNNGLRLSCESSRVHMVSFLWHFPLTP